jgi:pimeloyl-ACP methyl ester carboxylesterase
MMRAALSVLLALTSTQTGFSQLPGKHLDTSAHAIQFVSVEPGIRLEVVDFGGSGPAMIFLSALGGDAHDWDRFAPKLTGRYHAYAITRRGFGNSDKPPPTDENYSADRLGEDVLAVMGTLKLERPVLVGWSLGGEELSSVQNRFPAKVRALIYLDAGYPYAFYNRAAGEPLQDRAELRRLLNQAAHENPPSLELTRKLLASMTQNEAELRESIASDEKPDKVAPPPGMPPPMPPQMIAIMTNPVKYTNIPVPILAIFATQRDSPSQEEWRERQAKAFEQGVPTAHVVRIPHAGHDVFNTNEKDVLREMTAFLDGIW